MYVCLCGNNNGSTILCRVYMNGCIVHYSRLSEAAPGCLPALHISCIDVSGAERAPALALCVSRCVFVCVCVCVCVRSVRMRAYMPAGLPAFLPVCGPSCLPASPACPHARMPACVHMYVMLFYVMQCHAMPCYAMQCNAMLRHVVLYSVMQRNAT